MTCINLLANDVWSEEDIVAHGRAVINAQVRAERQQELQTIMLGHIAGMRLATADELTEIATVAAITEAQSAENVLARADMALLAEVLTIEEGSTALEEASEAAQVLHALRNPALENEGEQDAG
jgi:hypothetical protein